MMTKIDKAIEELSKLIKQSPAIVKHKYDGKTLLEIACEGPNPSQEVILLLLKSGYDFQDVKIFNKPLIEWAVNKGYSDVVNLLLNNTELHIAVVDLDVSRVKRLIKEGVDINAKDISGNAPIHLAVKLGDNKMLQALISANADLNATNNMKKTPLSIASENGFKDIANALVSYGAKLGNDRNPLHESVMKGDVTGTLTLIKQGLDVNTKDGNGRTPLHLAARVNADLVKILLENGAIADVRDKDGIMPIRMVQSEAAFDLISNHLKQRDSGMSKGR